MKTMCQSTAQCQETSQVWVVWALKDHMNHKLGADKSTFQQLAATGIQSALTKNALTRLDDLGR